MYFFDWEEFANVHFELGFFSWLSFGLGMVSRYYPVILASEGAELLISKGGLRTLNAYVYVYPL